MPQSFLSKQMDFNTKTSKIDVEDEEPFLKMLADHKWKDGFVCRKCGHDNYCKGKKPHSRRCTRCKTEESATANTIFHRCKMPLNEAIDLARLVCLQPGISTYERARQMERRQMTCWKFKVKILECLESPDKVSVLKRFLDHQDSSADIS